MHAYAGMSLVVGVRAIVCGYSTLVSVFLRVCVSVFVLVSGRWSRCSCCGAETPPTTFLWTGVGEQAVRSRRGPL